MKWHTFAALVAVTSTCGWADVPPPNMWRESCVGLAEGVTCVMEGGFRGKCVWLTHRERGAFGVRSLARCEPEGPRAGQCLTCMSESFRGGTANKRGDVDPAAAAKPQKAP